MFRLSILVAISLLFLNSCSSPTLDQLSLQTLKEEEVNLIQDQNNLQLLFFLAPDCPLSQNYSLSIREIGKQLPDAAEIQLIFSGRDYEAKEIEEFLTRYQLNSNMAYLDNNHQVIDYFKATVYPEALLLDVKNEKVYYQGKIDNWIEEIGQKRQIVSQFYLLNALEAFISGKEKIEPNYVKPLGCYID